MLSLLLDLLLDLVLELSSSSMLEHGLLDHSHSIGFDFRLKADLYVSKTRLLML